MNRPLILSVAALVALLALALWAGRGIERSLREIRAAQLRTALDTDAAELDAWIAERVQDARERAAREDVRARFAGRDAAAEGAQPRDPPALAGAAADVVLLDGHARLLASNAGNRPNPRFDDATLARMRAVLDGADHAVAPGLPSIWIAVPVRVGARTAGALAMGFRADPALAGVLGRSAPGRSGAVFVFDGRGGLFFRSAHAIDPLGAPPTEAAGDALARPRPIAAALARATSGESLRGIMLDPYPSGGDAERIGAWRLLPRHGLGIAVEMDAAEAYAALRYLHTGVAASGALLLLVWIAVFIPRETLARALHRGPALRQVGPYRILRPIGEGAVSTVYLARHRGLARAAAVKVLKAQSTTDESIARFAREVQLASGLRHPNTIVIYDYGNTAGGVFYYAMEYLEGLSLAELVEHYGPVPAGRAAHLLRQVCGSLAEAHANGLIHRDIKPQNIMTCELHGAHDVVKVLDFGLVKRLTGADTRDLSRSLRILGTPLYMAPERIRDPSAVGPRADIYSLGAVAFNLLTGRRLFETETDHDLTYHILHVEAPRAARHAPQPVPAEFDELIARCLAKDPAQRPASVDEVAATLDAILAAHPWNAQQIEAWWARNWIPADSPERRIRAG